MSLRSLRPLILAIPAAVALSLAGCVVVPAQPRYVGETVAVEPPPPQVEYVGAPPVVGYVWLGGYWGWHAGRHVWVGGHWEAPRPGYHWVPHAWVHEGGGWRMREGHWDRR